MNALPPRRSPIAGGALLALSILVGTAAGVAMRQPTIGLLGGLAVGIALCLIIWLIDSRRG